MMKLPKGRTENIVVQEAGDELLIYDLMTNKAFCLNETSAIVHQACDGKTDFNELKRRTNFTDELIFLALDALHRQKLLSDDYTPKFTGFSRREVIKKVGLTSMVALPVISGVIAPSAAHAQSLPACTASNDIFIVSGCGDCTNCACATSFCNSKCCSGTASFAVSISNQVINCRC